MNQSNFQADKQAQDRLKDDGNLQGTDTTSMAHQIAVAASAYQLQRTGHAPSSVSVVQSDGTLVITLHGALSPAEVSLAKTPAGAAKIQEFHRQLFDASSEPLRQMIKRITGVPVREAVAEIDPCTGTMVHAFTSGTMVHVFLLAHPVSHETWNAGVATSVQ